LVNNALKSLPSTFYWYKACDASNDRVKEELWKFKYFTMQKYNLQKKKKSSLKETKKTPSRYYYNSVTNLKFQYKPKDNLSKTLVSK
jgi:hypothetical protein